MLWFSSLVKPLWDQILLPCYNSRWKSELSLLRSYYLLKDHMGTHFSVYVRTQSSKGREKYGACAVDWGIAMLCTWVQRAGFSDFFIAQRITSPHSLLLYSTIQHITHCIYLYVKQKKKMYTLNLASVSFAGGKRTVHMPKLLQRLKMSFRGLRGMNLALACLIPVTRWMSVISPEWLETILSQKQIKWKQM